MITVPEIGSKRILSEFRKHFSNQNRGIRQAGKAYYKDPLLGMRSGAWRQSESVSFSEIPSYPFSAGWTQRSIEKWTRPGLGFKPRSSALEATLPTNEPPHRYESGV
ncbi:hypothetical protein PoB_006160400 [Plakobranchus ocellatus]|uniref:Uncharacterized protein n=1 Tax=Plakobranchus ocellatus TaxID=259542 RepID=A0AAV4CTA3_9GAST|nr:hypothetical protein PoB_006160400 [Plakobranchus ocellatus]